MHVGLGWFFAPTLTDQSDERAAESTRDLAAAAESTKAAMRKQIEAMQRDLAMLLKSAAVQRYLGMLKNLAGVPAASRTTPAGGPATAIANPEAPRRLRCGGAHR